MQFDTLLKGGHLIDPKNHIDTPKDLAITDGKVAAVDSDIPAEQAKQVLDVQGLYITPGLVDIHTHVCHPRLEKCLGRRQ
jgi:dihydroorotase